MKSIRYVILLLVILLVGLGLRIYDLDGESLWLDECKSVTVAQFDMPDLVKAVCRAGTNPPLHYVVLHYWIKIFGNSEFSIRFLSVVCSMICILMIYRLSILLFDEKVSTLAALMVSLSTYHIYFSQEARGYTLMSMLALLSMYFFVQLLRKYSFLASVGYIISSFLMLYTHPYSIFIIIAQNIYIFITLLFSAASVITNWKRWVLLQVILLMTFIPWVGILFRKTVEIQTARLWLRQVWLSDILYTLKEYSGESSVLAVLFIVLAAYSAVSLKKTQGSIDWKNVFGSLDYLRWNISLSGSNTVFLLSAWLLTPIILPIVVSRLSSPIFYGRYTIAASFAFYLLVAKGTLSINNKYLKFIIIAVIIFLYPLKTFAYYTRVDKEQWRQAADYVQTNVESGDLLLFHAGFCQNAFNYYSQRTDLIKKPFPSKGIKINEDEIQELQPIAENHGRIWVVLSHSGKNASLIIEKLNETHKVRYHRNFFRIEVYLFQKKLNL